MKEWTVVRRGYIKKLLVETVAYVINGIPFLDSHSPHCFEKWLKIVEGKALKMIPKYRRTETQSWSYGSEKNNNIWNCITLQSILALYLKYCL